MPVERELARLQAYEALLAHVDEDDRMRRSRVTVPGRVDRHALLQPQPQVYRTWLLVDRDNATLRAVDSNKEK